jgi:hypothetical protein
MRSTFIRDGRGVASELTSMLQTPAATFRTFTPRATVVLAAGTCSVGSSSPVRDGVVAPTRTAPSASPRTADDEAAELNAEFNWATTETPDAGAFTDSSARETLTATQPIRSGRNKKQWGAVFFGNIFHQPRNFQYPVSRAWASKFRMKKHRYKKRWRQRRYKLAALANMPFAKKLRVDMLPNLRSGKAKKDSAAADDFSSVSNKAQDAVAAAVQDNAPGKKKTKTTAKKGARRPKSKYQA